jgi:hypothetical protein
MTNKNHKSREWFLELSCDGTDSDGRAFKQCDLYFENRGKPSDIHVIEYSAYQDLADNCISLFLHKIRVKELEEKLAKAEAELAELKAPRLCTADMPSEWISATNGYRYVVESKWNAVLTELRIALKAARVMEDALVLITKEPMADDWGELSKWCKRKSTEALAAVAEMRKK